MASPLLGCIADDFTGATDLANTLVRSGMRVIQTIGVPRAPIDEEADAVVVALKTRTVSPDEAVQQSLTALAWLKSTGAKQFYFKYCSTFDSTAKGNIGCVTEALMDALSEDFTIACPAFPDNGRTVFKGYLFVGDELLHESGMRNHPLTPMIDSNLVRVMQSQTKRRVGLIDYRTVAMGSDAVRQRIVDLKLAGVSVAVVDATTNAELIQLGPVWADMPLVTAASGLAIGLPANFNIQPNSLANALPAADGPAAIVSGSCSEATNAQVLEFIQAGGAAFAIEPLQIAAGRNVVDEALHWASPLLGRDPVLIYATAGAEAVRSIQTKLGTSAAGELVEQTLSRIACGLVERGVRKLVVAGGETSGACVQALGVERMRIGPQIAPGVPWCFAPCPLAQPQGLHISLKSGNFGAPDFFSKAFDMLR
jgi:3-dehydrotetronate 4-kinase